ncbi:hypothetical protein V2J52_16820 [Georgenia sp. MJ173]|uniref:hypothetical protein n=1 Tax=Georgenia sunbinii TaxID=3117728 RepID=UPI002F2692C0
MTPAALWLIATIALVVGAGLIAWAVLRRARPALHAEILIWLTGSIALLVFTFWAFALVFGHGQLPNSEEDPDWLRSVILAAAPTAGLIGASVAVAISIRKQRTSEVADELATVRAFRDRFNTAWLRRRAVLRSGLLSGRER